MFNIYNYYGDSASSPINPYTPVVISIGGLILTIILTYWSFFAIKRKEIKNRIREIKVEIGSNCERIKSFAVINLQLQALHVYSSVAHVFIDKDIFHENTIEDRAIKDKLKRAMDYNSTDTLKVANEYMFKLDVEINELIKNTSHLLIFNIKDSSEIKKLVDKIRNYSPVAINSNEIYSYVKSFKYAKIVQEQLYNSMPLKVDFYVGNNCLKLQQIVNSEFYKAKEV